MWWSSIVIISLFLLAQQTGYSQVKSGAALQEALDYLNARSEVYLRIALPDPNQLAKISSIVSIDKITEDHIYLYADRKGFTEFAALDLEYEVITPVSFKEYVSMSDGNWQPGDWDVYPAFGDYVDAMQQFALDYPGICLLDTIGFSINDRPILVVKISDQVSTDEPEPGFFYSSSMHGDELTGYMLMLRLIDYILNGYDSIPKVTELVDQLQIWINPLANPDGTYFLGDYTVNQATRGNANGKDLNRDFPWIQWGGVPEDFSCQPENKAMIEFMEQHPPTMSANIHSGAELVNYPWDTWVTRHADDDWFRFVSRQYADSVQMHSKKNLAFENYFTQGNDGITNGFDWYYINGGRQDFVTYYLNGREVTLELSLDKAPPARQLPLYWEYNYPSLLNYMQQCLYGFRGTVRDKQTGDPIRARVNIVDHDMDRSYVFSDSLSGSYFRPVKGGTYDLRFTAPGYTEQKIEDLLISNFMALHVDVQLEKYPASLDEVVLNELTINILSNPFSEMLRISITVSKQLDVHYCLFDLYGRMATHPEKAILQPGDNPVRIDATGLLPGYYLLRICTPSREINSVVVKM
jgi:hypothetical protein